MSIRVRTAHADDAPVLAHLVQEYWRFEGISGFDHNRIDGLLRDLLSNSERGVCLIAENDHAPCGYLLAVYLFSLEHGGMTAEIDEFFVVPEHRLQGTGTALLKAAQGLLQERGCVHIQLQLGVSNESARAFYSREGFEKRAGYELWDKAVPGR